MKIHRKRFFFWVSVPGKALTLNRKKKRKGFTNTVIFITYCFFLFVLAAGRLKKTYKPPQPTT